MKVGSRRHRCMASTTTDGTTGPSRFGFATAISHSREPDMRLGALMTIDGSRGVSVQPSDRWIPSGFSQVALPCAADVAACRACGAARVSESFTESTDSHAAPRLAPFVTSLCV